MSVVSFLFDLNTREITVVTLKGWCVSCNVRQKKMEDAAKCYRCLCIDCLNQGVLGYLVPLEYSQEVGEWEYFTQDIECYQLRNVGIYDMLAKMKQHQITLVPIPLSGRRLPNCSKCHLKTGKKEMAHKLGRQLCWDCLVALK